MLYRSAPSSKATKQLWKAVHLLIVLRLLAPLILKSVMMANEKERKTT
jgi:hypothetical protein